MPKTGRKFPKDKCSEIQSVLFSKDKWKEKDVRKWLGEHGYYTDGIEESGSYIRARQFDPNASEEIMRWINFSDDRGISAIYSRKMKCENKKK